MFTLPKFTKTQILIGLSLGVLAFAATTLVLVWRSVGTAEAYLKQPPRNLPIASVQPTAPAAVSTRQRVETFAAAVQRGEAAEIRLTTAELNTLIATQEELASWRGRLYVESIGGDSIKLQISIPLQAMGLTDKRLVDKYLNGDLHLNAGMHNNDLKLDLISFTDKGEQVPALIRSQVGQLVNLELLRERYPESGSYMDRIEGLTLANDEIHIVVGALVR